MSGEATFTPSEADYVAALRLQSVRQLQARKFWVRLVLIFVAIACICSILPVVLDGSDWPHALLWGLLPATGGIAGLAICVGLGLSLLPRRARRLYRQQKTLHREMNFTWDAEGTRWTTDHGNVRTSWTDYHRWTEGNATILLYLNDSMMQFLPKRAFGRGALDDLRRTIAAAPMPSA